MLPHREFPTMQLRREPRCSSETTPEAKHLFPSYKIVIPPIPFFIFYFFFIEVHKAWQSLLCKIPEALLVLIAWKIGFVPKENLEKL